MWLQLISPGREVRAAPGEDVPPRRGMNISGSHSGEYSLLASLEPHQMMISPEDRANDPGWMWAVGVVPGEGRGGPDPEGGEVQHLLMTHQINQKKGKKKDLPLLNISNKSDTHLLEKFIPDWTNTTAGPTPPDRSIGAHPGGDTHREKRLFDPAGQGWHRLAVNHLPLCCAQHCNLYQSVFACAAVGVLTGTSACVCSVCSRCQASIWPGSVAKVRWRSLLHS